MHTEKHTLEQLVYLTQDSVNGYREAAKLVKEENPALAALFEDRLHERLQILEPLRTQLKVRDPDNQALQNNGTVSGYLHQSFMKFRTLFQDDQKAALAEVDRGESLLADTFEDAVKQVGPQLKTSLEQALMKVRADERTIEALLEDAH